MLILTLLGILTRSGKAGLFDTSGLGSWLPPLILFAYFSSCYEGYFLVLSTRLNDQYASVTGQLFICVQ